MAKLFKIHGLIYVYCAIYWSIDHLSPMMSFHYTSFSYLFGHWLLSVIVEYFDFALGWQHSFLVVLCLDCKQNQREIIDRGENSSHLVQYCVICHIREIIYIIPGMIEFKVLFGNHFD